MAEECSKFGPVRECVVYEHKDFAVSKPEEAVRTFVVFEKQESAIKVQLLPAPLWPPRCCRAVLLTPARVLGAQAFMHMEGRFFAGRQIQCAFYSERRYESRDLVPMEDEAQ